MKKERGITLIALVVTIIVLLILAGITISLVVGQNGIITRANEASIRQDNGTVMEALNMLVAGEKIEQKGGEVDAVRFLQNNAYLDSNGIVNVAKVVGKELKTGKGSSTDIYTIESSKVYYIDKEGNKRELGEIETTVLEETSPDYFDFDPETGTIWLKGATKYYDKDYFIDLDTIVVPSQMDGVTVKKIGKYGFSITNAKKIILPDTIEEIEEIAFSGKYRKEYLLEEIILSKNLKKISYDAFSYNSNLKEIILPNSVTSIEGGTFYGCTSLTNITIPNSVTSIEAAAFYRCTSLTNITIPDSVISIGNMAFEETAFEVNLPNGEIYLGRVFYKYKGEMSVNTKVDIKEGTISITDSAFKGCTSLTNVTIPNSVTSIGGYAFGGCTNLTNITIPDSVISIGDGAFEDTAFEANLPNGEIYLGKVFYKYKGEMPVNTKVDIKEGTISITDSAFKGCTSLTNVTIPNSVTSIGGYAFWGCTSLTDITIPNSVTLIGGAAFYKWTSSQTINIDRKEPTSSWNEYWNDGCEANIKWKQ